MARTVCKNKAIAKLESIKARMKIGKQKNVALIYIGAMGLRLG